MAYRLVIRSHLKKLLEWLLSMDQNRPSKVRKSNTDQPYTFTTCSVCFVALVLLNRLHVYPTCFHVSMWSLCKTFFMAFFLLNVEKSHFYHNWTIFCVLIGGELCSIRVQTMEIMWWWCNLFFSFSCARFFKKIQRKWTSKLSML